MVSRLSKASSVLLLAIVAAAEDDSYRTDTHRGAAGVGDEPAARGGQNFNASLVRNGHQAGRPLSMLRHRRRGSFSNPSLPG